MNSLLTIYHITQAKLYFTDFVTQSNHESNNQNLIHCLIKRQLAWYFSQNCHGKISKKIMITSNNDNSNKRLDWDLGLMR